MPRHYTPKVQCLCQECGAAFFVKASKPKHGRGHYCSRPCAFAAMVRQRTPKQVVERTCEQCGEFFQADPYRVVAGLARFCSTKCSATARYPSPLQAMLDRLNIVPETGCWEYTGHRNEKGYGRIGAHGTREWTHRLAAQWFLGMLPSDRRPVLHLCDNPPCFCPDHLTVGDHDLNMRQRDERQRTLRGVTHPMAKLDEATVVTIRRRLHDKEPLAKLALEYGVAITTISAIGTRASWRHL